MSEFDPIKAVREELVGLHDVLAVMRRGERVAEEAMAAAESDLNAIRKLRGYAQLEVERLKARIASLENPPDARS